MLEEQIPSAEDKLVAKFGILVYETGNTNYMEYFDVRGNKTINHAPLTKELFKKLQQFDSNIQLINCNGNLSDVNIVRVGQSIMGPELIFWHKPKAFNITSTSEDIPSGKHKFPATIYIYKNSKLKVFMMDTKTLTKKTKFYSAPFYNTYSGGERCTGNNDLSKIDNSTDYRDIVNKIIALSWYSVFNDHLKNETRFKIPLKEIYEKKDFISYSKEIKLTL